ncbi:unnamed protein product [Schistocephalus solidus]|uniref:Pleckstrin homology domain-containing family H member 2 n=1 Tax=Schistocephalus solidus TaxID=70667 RepID=A0A183T8P0_SCHSO|nr:unnamed protein product [Schistocephalus solidus]
MDANITDLQARLEVAERLLAEQLPNVAREAVEHVNATLEAERLQLQEELDRRLADCGSTHALSIAELEATRANLTAKLATAETRATQLETELKASIQRLRSTERFLNEQLQEREQEREEFQTEVDFWKGQVTELKNKIFSLELQLSQKVSSSPSFTPPETPRLPPSKMGVGNEESAISTSPPSSPPPPTAIRGPIKSNFASKLEDKVPPPAPGSKRKLVRPIAAWQDSPETDVSMNSDVDDSVPFELVGNLRRPFAIPLSLQPLKLSSPTVQDTNSDRFTSAAQRWFCASPQAGKRLRFSSCMSLASLCSSPSTSFVSRTLPSSQQDLNVPIDFHHCAPKHICYASSLATTPDILTKDSVPADRTASVTPAPPIQNYVNELDSQLALIEKLRSEIADSESRIAVPYDRRRPVAISAFSFQGPSDSKLPPQTHSRPLSADLDSRFSMPPACYVRSSDKVSVCVGGCPVEVTDTAVSPRSTTSASLSASFDSDVADSCSYEGEDIGRTTETTVTTRTISAAMGLITTQTTTSSSKPPARKRGLARHRNNGNENTLDLSVEMQHAAQLEELRTALSRAEAQLAERDAAAEQLRKELVIALARLPEPSAAVGNTSPTAPSYLPGLPPSTSPLEFSFQHSLDSVTPLPSLTDDTGVGMSGTTATTEASKFAHPLLQAAPAVPSSRLFVNVAAQTAPEEMEREANSPITEAIEDDTLKPRSVSLGASDSGPAPEEVAESLPLESRENDADDLSRRGLCRPVEEEELLKQEQQAQKQQQQPIFSRESTMSPTHTATDSLSTAAASGVTSVDSCDVESDVAQVTCAATLTSLAATSADQYPEVSDIHQLVVDLEDARAEITSLRAEIEGLMVYQDDLHHDFELVQTMLEDRQSEVERLQQDLLVAQSRVQSDFDNPIRKPQRRVTEPYAPLEERDEDLYMLNEAKTELANRVRELEEELDSLRRHSMHVDVSETASQTDPSTPTISTSDSAIQVDLTSATSYLPGFHEELPQSPRRTSTVAGILTPDSDSDTDCVSEDYLPFDCPGGETVVSNMQTTPILVGSQLPLSAQEDVNSPEAVKALVEHLHYESCRLLSLSLAMSARNTTSCEVVKSPVTSSTTMPPSGNAIENFVDTGAMGADYKSQALTRLIEANRLLKNLLESLMTSKETESTPDHRPSLGSSSLVTTLLSILVADRKAYVSLLCNAAIEQGSKLGLPPRPLSGPQQKNIPTLTDFIRSLTAYVDAEEQRWSTLTSAVTADRQELKSEIESVRQREATLKSEVSRLSGELAARNAVLLEKAASVDKQLAASERELGHLRAQLEETNMECQKLTATLEQTRLVPLLLFCTHLHSAE